MRRRRAAALAVLGALGLAGVILVAGGDRERGKRADLERARVAAESEPAPPAPRDEEEVRTEPDRRPVPILMYHEVAPAPEDAAYPDLFVAPDDFERQIRWLERRGYEAVTMATMFGAWRGRAELPDKPVVLSFDDGLRGQYDNALPILAERGWPGVLNVKLEALEQGELTDGMVREMLEAGWELGSHTLTHADVATLDGRELRREVEVSKRRLERRFGVEVEFFCYPAGSYDAGAIEAVRNAGYRGATTTEPGLAGPRDGRFTLPRLRVGGADGAKGLAATLEAAEGAGRE